LALNTEGDEDARVSIEKGRQKVDDFATNVVS
jgi:hypothetical protein